MVGGLVDPVAGEIVGTRSGPSLSHTSIGDPLRDDSALSIVKARSEIHP